jgi:hypothetical protein
MSDKLPTKEICLNCKKSFLKSGLIKHLKSCVLSILINNKTPSYLLNIYNGELFWIKVLINGDTTFDILDSFLRDLWLECCGHLSHFKIKGEYYTNSHPYLENGEKTMSYKIKTLLSKGLTFSYTYDFGTSTDLTLEVKERFDKGIKQDLKLLARNRKLEIQCWICNNNLVTTVCSECFFMSEDFLFCDKCKTKHDCDEEMYLKFVNSPRTGFCAYEG